MKILLIAISMVLVIGGLPAYAGGSSRAPSYLGYSSGEVNAVGTIVNTRGTVIYNMTLNSYNASNATLTIYDSPIYPFTSIPQEEVIYEVEVSSSGNSTTVDMNAAPLQTYTGLVASVTNGVAYLNVEK